MTGFLLVFFRDEFPAAISDRISSNSPRSLSPHGRVQKRMHVRLPIARSHSVTLLTNPSEQEAKN